MTHPRLIHLGSAIAYNLGIVKRCHWLDVGMLAVGPFSQAHPPNSENEYDCSDRNKRRNNCSENLFRAHRVEYKHRLEATQCFS